MSRVIVIQDDSADAVKQTITKYLGTALISIYGRCSASYEGSASATTELGEKLLLLKKDKTALLHGLQGMKPINWQTTPAISLKVKDNELIIRAESRTKRGSFVEVKFSRIDAVIIYQGEKAQQSLIGSESDLVQYLEENPDLIIPGFQVLSKERNTEFGYIDILGLDDKGTLTIVEVKRRTAGTKDVQQLRRYVEAICEQRKESVRGILVAPNIGAKALNYLKSLGFEFRRANLGKIVEDMRNHEQSGPSLEDFLEDPQ